MKNISAIKRHEALISFSKDHHFGLLLVWKIRQGLKMKIQPERISNYTITFFEKDLTDHFKQEEKNLFSKLSPDDSLRQQAFQEHEKIKDLIDRLQKDKLNIGLLEEFAVSLENHIRFEERVLFNHLQNTLSTEELIRGTEEHGKHKCDVDDKWSDHFWIIK
jgi:hypothetical protein